MSRYIVCDRCCREFCCDLAKATIIDRGKRLEFDICPDCKEEILDFIETRPMHEPGQNTVGSPKHTEAVGPFMKTYANALRSVATEITSTCDIIESMLTDNDEESEEDEK